eukprot:PhM_4_TR5375/c0_g1_i1/m.85453
MPSLGIGGCTPYAQPSNYHTASNHNFREEAPYDVQKQQKVKCTGCGCWVRKCGVCYLCRKPQKMVPTPRNNNQRVASPSLSRLSNGSTSMVRPRTASTGRHNSNSNMSTVSQNISHAFYNDYINSQQQQQQQQPTRGRSFGTAFDPNQQQQQQQRSFYQDPVAASCDGTGFYVAGDNNNNNRRAMPEEYIPYYASNRSASSSVGPRSHSTTSRHQRQPTASVSGASVSGAGAAAVSVAVPNAKVKCGYCGIWVVKGTNCKLCRKPCKLY